MKGTAGLLVLLTLTACGMLPRRTDPPVMAAPPDAPATVRMLPVARVLRVHEQHAFAIIESRIPLQPGSEGTIYRAGQPAVVLRVTQLQGRIAAAEILQGSPRHDERVRFPVPQSRPAATPHRPRRR